MPSSRPKLDAGGCLYSPWRTVSKASHGSRNYLSDPQQWPSAEHFIITRGSILPSPCPRSHSAGPKPRPRCSNETLLDRALIKSGPSIDWPACRPASHICPAKHRAPRRSQETGWGDPAHGPQPELPGTSRVTWELPAPASLGPPKRNRCLTYARCLPWYQMQNRTHRRYSVNTALWYFRRNPRPQAHTLPEVFSQYKQKHSG